VNNWASQACPATVQGRLLRRMAHVRRVAKWVRPGLHVRANDAHVVHGHGGFRGMEVEFGVVS
jgi:hypothetical protein